MHSREKQDSCETFLFSGSMPRPFFSLKNRIFFLFFCRKNKNPEDSWGILCLTLFYKKNILPENRKMQPRGELGIIFWWIITSLDSCHFVDFLLGNTSIQAATKSTSSASPMSPTALPITSATWLGNPFRILRNSAINPIPDLLNSGIFLGILFFRS